MARAHALDPCEGPSSPHAFYARVLDALGRARVPFLVGGAYALKHHCGVTRATTKDLDLFLVRDDLDRARDVLEACGYRTELAFPHWLAKAHSGAHFVDVIFNGGNGVAPVDVHWFARASRTRLFGVDVAICPVEETIWSKAYVMERERFDGADIAHLIAARGGRIDWRHLLDRFADGWRVLFAHLVLFGFVYPDRREAIPAWVTDELSARLRAERASEEHVCKGTLLSREQYLSDLANGYADARIGAMSDDEIRAWTEEINRK